MTTFTTTFQSKSSVESMAIDAGWWVVHLVSSWQFLASFVGMAVITIGFGAGVMRTAMRSLALRAAEARRVE